MNTAKVMLNNSITKVDGAKQTDLPVLLPLAAQARHAALIERREGTYRLNMQPRHALWVFVIVIAAAASAQAATPEGLLGHRQQHRHIRSLRAIGAGIRAVGHDFCRIHQPYPGIFILRSHLVMP